MSKFVKDTDLGYRDLKERMNDLASHPFVKVGVISGEKGGSSEIATYAGANEFGTSDGRIPERSFIRSTMNRIGFALFKMAEKYLEDAAKKNKSPLKTLDEMGLFAAARIVNTITTLRTPPNAPATMAQKKGVDNPLIDEGRLKNSIAHVVVK